MYCRSFQVRKMPDTPTGDVLVLGHVETIDVELIGDSESTSTDSSGSDSA